MSVSNLVMYDELGSFELESTELAEVAGGAEYVGVNVSCPGGNDYCGLLAINAECGANGRCLVGINGECGAGAVEIRP